VARGIEETVPRKRSDLRGFDLRFGYVMAEKTDQKPHNKRVKETSEVFETVLHDHLNYT
jgi:hypothetical protein